MTRARLLTLFNLLAGGASMAGLWISLQIGYTGAALLMISLITLFVTGYVLFVPGTSFEQNVRSKTEVYSVPANVDAAELHMQRGEVAIQWAHPKAVRFPAPFAEPPHVEIIDTNGHLCVPVPEKITIHQFVAAPPYTLSDASKVCVYEWVAEGRLLSRKA